MKIIIHGGISESESHKTAKRISLEMIVRKSYAFLHNHSAAETAAYTVSLLEDDQLFNAGSGSQIQSDGTIRMSAAIMDDALLRMAGVINIEKVRIRCL